MKKRMRKRRSAKNTKTQKRPTALRQYLRMASNDQITWDSVTQVISRMRDGVSLPQAAREYDITPQTVMTLGRSAIRKRKGRYVATKTDRLLRVLNILEFDGKQIVAVRDSREASAIGAHWSAAQTYLVTGKSIALERLKKTKITDASGKRHFLLTDLKKLNSLGATGVLRFESIYASVA